MYVQYLSQTDDVKDAVRQMCRKLDLYWNEDLYQQAVLKGSPQSMIIPYLAKINQLKYAGRSYDDTLIEENALWTFGKVRPSNDDSNLDADGNTFPEDEPYVATPEVIAFWGTGYSNEMYEELENRFAYWRSRLPDDFNFDIGTEALIRQICSLELDINRDRSSGKAIDKSVAALNTLLGSLNLKPAQRKDDAESALENTPFGVWIRRWENERPIPEPDPELKDTDGIIKYILIWLYGHLAKMLNVKNIHSKLYEDEIAKLRVEHPQYDDEDDESMLNDIFGDDDEQS